MTRVNLVDPKYLADQHLFAEYRELKHVPKSLLRSLKTRKWEDIKKEIPKEFTLGKGHVKFFWNKMRYILERFTKCHAELIVRGYNIPETSPDIVEDLFVCRDIDMWLDDIMCHYDPDDTAIKKSVARINEKIMMKPEWYKYYGVSYPIGILGVDK